MKSPVLIYSSPQFFILHLLPLVLSLYFQMEQKYLFQMRRRHSHSDRTSHTVHSCNHHYRSQRWVITHKRGRHRPLSSYQRAIRARSCFLQGRVASFQQRRWFGARSAKAGNSVHQPHVLFSVSDSLTTIDTLATAKCHCGNGTEAGSEK